MKKLIVIIAAAFLISSCEKVNGDGPVVKETRSTSSFTGLDIRIPADVTVIRQPVHQVELHAQQNILNLIETYISNDRLVIKFDNDVNIRHHKPITITVNAQQFNSLRLSGSGNINVPGTLDPATMDIGLSGSGNIFVSHLVTGDIDGFVSGSGNITVLNGAAEDEDFTISGSGNIDMGGVNAVTAKTFTSGSGNIRLHASQRLNATISGSGNVYYRGNPVINSTISGSGKLIRY